VAIAAICENQGRDQDRHDEQRLRENRENDRR
jgi:hypothetical protein